MGTSQQGAHIAHWRDEYVARSEILRKLQKWFEEGLSDEDIGRHFGNDAENVWRLRTRYHFFRPEECPDCGCREFVPGVECPNRRCITVWPKLWEQARQREERRRK